MRRTWLGYLRLVLSDCLSLEPAKCLRSRAQEAHYGVHQVCEACVPQWREGMGVEYQQVPCSQSRQ